jgi:hypothetical protein
LILVKRGCIGEQERDAAGAQVHAPARVCKSGWANIKRRTANHQTPALQLQWTFIGCDSCAEMPATELSFRATQEVCFCRAHKKQISHPIRPGSK